MHSTFLPRRFCAAARFLVLRASVILPGMIFLLPCLRAGAQSAQPSAEDMHRLQEQVTALTARITFTGFLVSGVLLVFMGCACLGLWWKARWHKQVAADS